MSASHKVELYFTYVRQDEDRYVGTVHVVEDGIQRKQHQVVFTRPEWVRFVVSTIRANPSVKHVSFKFDRKDAPYYYVIHEETLDRLRDEQTPVEDFIL